MQWQQLNDSGKSNRTARGWRKEGFRSHVTRLNVWLLTGGCARLQQPNPHTEVTRVRNDNDQRRRRPPPNTSGSVPVSISIFRASVTQENTPDKRTHTDSLPNEAERTRLGNSHLGAPRKPSRALTKANALFPDLPDAHKWKFHRNANARMHATAHVHLSRVNRGHDFDHQDRAKVSRGHRGQTVPLRCP